MISAGGMGKTTAEMQMAETFLEAGWDLVGETANGTKDFWGIEEGRDYPRLWWEAAEMIIHRLGLRGSSWLWERGGRAIDAAARWNAAQPLPVDDPSGRTGSRAVAATAAAIFRDICRPVAVWAKGTVLVATIHRVARGSQ